MPPGRRHENTVPLLAVGVAVGMLLGTGGVVAAEALFDHEDPRPLVTPAEVERAAESLQRINRHCSGCPRPSRPSITQRAQARDALEQLLRMYRREPDKRYRLDDSGDPLTLDASLEDIAYDTFDGPCPGIAQRAKRELVRGS